MIHARMHPASFSRGLPQLPRRDAHPGFQVVSTRALFLRCRISCFKNKPSSSVAGSGSRNSNEAGKDPNNVDRPAAAPFTTRSHVAGRRLRSDSPVEDGALDAQPLKRQNSLGEVDLEKSASADFHQAATAQGRRVSSSKEGSGDAAAMASAPTFLKALSFPPSRMEHRKSAEDSTHHSANTNECPPYGSKSVIGRRAKMEDAFVAVPYLMEVPLQREADELLPPRLAPQLRSNSNGSSASETTAAGVGATGTGGGSSSTQQDSDMSSACCSEEILQATMSGSSGTYSSLDPSHHRRAPEPIPGSTFTLPIPIDASLETLHFFGVFDGHGGADAAMHCAKTLHKRVKEVLSALTSPGAAAGRSASGKLPEVVDAAEATSVGAVGVSPEAATAAVLNSNGDSPAVTVPAAARAAAAAIGATEGAVVQSHSESSGSSFLDVEIETEAAEGEESEDKGLGPAASIEGVQCTTETVETALTKAFHLTDEEFGAMGGYEHLALVGTTAVVTLVGRRMIYVANCGDSRAVLCRGGQAVPLTDDHKAAREDETARVEAAGGQILFWNGVRVMGLLAVSRAIGDHSLRPYVIAEPEVTIINRHGADELLVLASDGLWDVMSNQEACNLAKKCLMRARQRGSSRQSAARVAATVLTRAAVDRGSRDNVTVVIVDLTSPGAEAEAVKAQLGRSHSTLQSQESGSSVGAIGISPPEAPQQHAQQHPRQPPQEQQSVEQQHRRQKSVEHPQLSRLEEPGEGGGPRSVPLELLSPFNMDSEKQ